MMPSRSVRCILVAVLIAVVCGLSCRKGMPVAPDALAVVVKDRSWTRYDAEGMLYCPKGKRLRIDLMIGGIIFASMHVDGLTIERAVR
jgi:hypothetical protein